MENPFENIEQKLARIENLLLSMQKQEQPAEPEPDTWFNIDKLCEYLPDKPAKATIYGKVHCKVIPYHKQGKSLIFRKSEIDDWLNRGRIKTVAETMAEADHYLRRKGNV